MAYWPPLAEVSRMTRKSRGKNAREESLYGQAYTL